MQFAWLIHGSTVSSDISDAKTSIFVNRQMKRVPNRSYVVQMPTKGTGVRMRHGAPSSKRCAGKGPLVGVRGIGVAEGQGAYWGNGCPWEGPVRQIHLRTA